MRDLHKDELDQVYGAGGTGCGGKDGSKPHGGDTKKHGSTKHHGDTHKHKETKKHGSCR